MSRGYSRYKVKTGWMHYYFMWSTFLNKPLLENTTSQLEKTITKKLGELNCELCALQIYSEKVYLGVKATPLLSPHRIVSVLKAETFRMLKLNCPYLLKVPSVWTRGYFVSTYGKDPIKDVKAYERFVKRQVKAYKRKERISRE